MVVNVCFQSVNDDYLLGDLLIYCEDCISRLKLVKGGLNVCVCSSVKGVLLLCPPLLSEPPHSFKVASVANTVQKQEINDNPFYSGRKQVQKMCHGHLHGEKYK